MPSDDTYEVDAFLLLSLPDCTIRTPTDTHTGILELECVTLPPSAQATFERDVFLVFRINELEIPIDPARTVSLNDSSKEYVFHGTETDPFGVFTLTFSELLYSTGSSTEDLQTFESVLSQYVTAKFNRSSDGPPVVLDSPNVPEKTAPLKDEDLRGRLVLRDEDSGEFVGEFDGKVVVKEDPILYMRGHENDPVVIEVPGDVPLDPNSGTAIEVFARSVPPDQHDWMMKSAILVSHAITRTTNIVVRVISSASRSYYDTCSAPQPSTSAQSISNFLPNPPSIPIPRQPPPQSRTARFLNSERTRTALAKAHAVSAQAVRISSIAKPFVGSVVHRMVGVRPGTQAPQYGQPPQQGPPYGVGYGPAPSASFAPPLSCVASGAWQPPFSLPTRQLSPKARMVLSADLILSTIEESAKRIVTAGTEHADVMIRQKYGPEVASSSAAITGTARNVGLVYIDMQGIARRAMMMRIYMKTGTGFPGRI